MSKNSFNSTLLVLAAGMGSRYNGLKQLDGFGSSGETIIDYTLYDAIKVGFSKVVFVIRKDLEEQFKRLYVNKLQSKIEVELVFQELDSLPANYSPPKGRTKPWGTGHALLLCKDVIENPFVIVNADDLYGRSALQLIHDYMRLNQHHKKSICLAGYYLNKTLSSNGGVSRGICEVDPNFRLKSIVEAVELFESKGKIQGKIKNTSSKRAFTGEEIVSMNLIGMVPDLFPLLASAFEDFISKNHQNLDAEFYIPDFINGIISSHIVQVVKTASTWHGVTYRSDKSLVKESIASLVAQDVYPNHLWE
ncbi:sugar phosphate nucleotidyltransferase [Ekhidna sp.]